MSMWDELKSLVKGGTAAAVPTPEVAASAPEPVSAVATIPAEPAVVSPVSASSQEAIELDDLGENPKRAVDPAEEERTDLPQRSRQRIAFLLANYEKDNLPRTQARIQNDRERHLFAKPVKNWDKKPDRNPQARLISPDAEAPSVGTWRV